MRAHLVGPAAPAPAVARGRCAHDGEPHASASPTASRSPAGRASSSPARHALDDAPVGVEPSCGCRASEAGEHERRAAVSGRDLVG
ncbi:MULTISPECIES: hypothetical protein [unclassified Agrococcus]|uniref:hypothetical protein n=1 Tax=unclassified Agrococcus TaxID=2615065 RepID=UPI0036102EDC